MVVGPIVTPLLGTVVGHEKRIRRWNPKLKDGTVGYTVVPLATNESMLPRREGGRRVPPAPPV